MSNGHANGLQVFWHFMRLRKKFWLLPALITMMALGGVMLFDHVLPLKNRPEAGSKRPVKNRTALNCPIADFTRRCSVRAGN